VRRLRRRVPADDSAGPSLPEEVTSSAGVFGVLATTAGFAHGRPWSPQPWRRSRTTSPSCATYSRSGLRRHGCARRPRATWPGWT
jgi:hypothetical protein